MATKPTLLSTTDVNGTTVKLGDRVAYVKPGSYRHAVHSGIVKRITEHSVWILPDEKFVHDKSCRTYDVTNGESYYLPGTCKRNPNFAYLQENVKTQVYDMCLRPSKSIMKIA